MWAFLTGSTGRDMEQTIVSLVTGLSKVQSILNIVYIPLVSKSDTLNAGWLRTYANGHLLCDVLLSCDMKEVGSWPSPSKGSSLGGRGSFQLWA